MEEGIKRLKDMMMWSDRLGSDELFEIQEIIKILQNDKSRNSS